MFDVRCFDEFFSDLRIDVGSKGSKRLAKRRYSTQVSGYHSRKSTASKGPLGNS